VVPEFGASRDAHRRRRYRCVVERHVVRVQRESDRQRQRDHHVHEEQFVDEYSGQSGPVGRGAPVFEPQRGHRERGQAQSVRIRGPVGDAEE